MAEKTERSWLQKRISNLLEPAISDAVATLRKDEASPVNLDSARPSAFNVPADFINSNYSFGGFSNRKWGSSVDFRTLRAFSVVYDVARACINHRKRQIENLDWNVLPKDDKKKAGFNSADVAPIEAFFENPSRGQDFKTWVDKILEDLMVFDGAALWKDKTYGGKLTELLPVDAETIRLMISSDGSPPEPPNPAFQQMLNGQPAHEYTSDEMYYLMINPRSNTPYGLGPLESLIIGVDAALRSQMFNNSLLSEGTVPEGLMLMPEGMSPDQVRDFQTWFDTMLAGNPNQQSRIKFLPGGKGAQYIGTKKAGDMKFVELEKWLLMKCCAVMDVQPQDIGFTGDVHYGQGAEQRFAAGERGLVPMARFLKKFFDQIIAVDFGRPDLEFEFEGLQAIDTQFELDRQDTLLHDGSMTIDEIRNSQGLDPFGFETTTTPFLMTMSGPIFLTKKIDDMEPPVKAPATPAASQSKTTPTSTPSAKAHKMLVDAHKMDEILKWRKKAVNYAKQGKALPVFKAAYIDKPVMELINARLTAVETAEDVRGVFDPIIEVMRKA